MCSYWHDHDVFVWYIRVKNLGERIVVNPRQDTDVWRSYWTTSPLSSLAQWCHHHIQVSVFKWVSPHDDHDTSCRQPSTHLKWPSAYSGSFSRNGNERNPLWRDAAATRQTVVTWREHHRWTSEPSGGIVKRVLNYLDLFSMSYIPILWLCGMHTHTHT